MSRELKFRAWDKKSKRWVKVNEFTDIDNDGVLYATMTSPDSDVELMQFTGLKDKNGVEIYEGDFLSFYEDGPIYQVCFGDAEVDGFGYWGWFAQNTVGGECCVLGMKCEVIGNIYEN